MINFLNISNEEPMIILRDLYNTAITNKQLNIEAIFISSFSHKLQEANSRIVNIKSIIGNEFIFFSNYDSPKSIEFEEQNKISAIFFWNAINVQIRMKAEIKRTSYEFSQKHFMERPTKKNALAISSNQSKPIDSYNQVKENYNKSLKNDDLKKCPEFWGGYSFTPYYFEFWEGHESRLNKREAYEKSDDSWKHLILQP